MDFTDLKGIEIIAVTKGQPLSKILSILELEKIKNVGINYVQQGHEIISALPSHITKHFIGHIQSRKIKDLVDYDWVQSIDRLEVAKKLNEKLIEKNKTQKILIEINMDPNNEPQKSGVKIEDLDGFIFELNKLQKLQLRGLMCLPPPLNPVELRAPYFKRLRKVLDHYHVSLPSFNVLSAGTSEDYKIAVTEGSNMIRLGTVLFGPRT